MGVVFESNEDREFDICESDMDENTNTNETGDNKFISEYKVEQGYHLKRKEIVKNRLSETFFNNLGSELVRETSIVNISPRNLRLPTKVKMEGPPPK
jgi:hypothetical protein